MKKSRNLFKRKKAHPIDNDAIENEAMENETMTITPELTLKCGKHRVTGIACIPTHELIAVSTSMRVYIHGYFTQGEPVRLFDDHNANVSGVLHLSDDILASVDMSGTLLTWRAGTGVLLDEIKVSETRFRSIAKASATEILVGTKKGEVIIFAHTDGKNLTVKERCKCDDDEWIWDISAYNDVFAAVTDRNVEIWNYNTGKRLNSIQQKGLNFCKCAVSDKLIVIGSAGCRIYIHELLDEYNLLRTIDLRNFYHFRNDNTWIRDITFLNADIVMVKTDDEGIFFVSVESGQCIFRSKLENSNELYRGTVLSDGRVCVGGDGGCCSIFTPPREMDLFISDFMERMYSHPIFSLIPFFSEPLQATLEAVQSNAFSITLAVDLVVNTKYHYESIEKWAHAHLIVMNAVKSGDVPRSREFNGDVIFWWNHLYKKASLIEMGKQDRQRVLQFIIEAEKVGILGGGCAETFQATKEIRSEMNVLSATIDDLYTRQIAMAEQVQGILHHQRIQQAVSFVNAILACIPFAGGIVGHVISGGMAVLENAEGEDGLEVVGLVESLLGIGKEWSSFITERIVERFIKAGEVVLEEKTWKSLPEANRRAVEAAADGLGLSIDELRNGFRGTAQKELSTPSATIVVEVEEENNGITDGDEGGTVVVDATSESLSNLCTGTNVNQERIEKLNSRLGEKKSEERDIAKLWKVIEMMQLDMKKDKLRREIIEDQMKEERVRREIIEEKMKEERVRREIIEDQMKEERVRRKVQEVRNNELEKEIAQIASMLEGRIRDTTRK